MALSVGDKLGPYEILAPLGAGGMGEVYRATDTRLHREVAIKTTHEQFSDRFDREARAIASLNHPNICQLYDVGPDYLVMELLEGETLATRLNRGKLPMNETLRYGAQIADALAAAHAKGVIHRDLKPGNVMITKGGIKVVDFGLAKSREPMAVRSRSQDGVRMDRHPRVSGHAHDHRPRATAQPLGRRNGHAGGAHAVDGVARVDSFPR